MQLVPAEGRAGKICVANSQQLKILSRSLRTHATSSCSDASYGGSQEGVYRFAGASGEPRGQISAILLLARKAINAIGSGRRPGWVICGQRFLAAPSWLCGFVREQVFLFQDPGGRVPWLRSRSHALSQGANVHTRARTRGPGGSLKPAGLGDGSLFASGFSKKQASPDARQKAVADALGVLSVAGQLGPEGSVFQIRADDENENRHAGGNQAIRRAGD